MRDACHAVVNRGTRWRRYPVNSDGDEARCYRLFEVQLSRGTSQISIIGPDFLSSVDLIHPFCEDIQIALTFESLRVFYTSVAA